MSEHSSFVTDAHVHYLAAHTQTEDAFLTSLRHHAAAAGIPTISIAHEQAVFMQILLKLHRARDVVEVGTLAGYSAIMMARALPPQGHLQTIEFVDQHATFAEEWIGRSDAAGKITVHRGAGQEILPSFQTQSADAIFLDADKANYPLYLKEGLRILRPGGLVMADNAFAFGQLFDDHPTDSEVPAIRAFNEVIASQTGLQSIIVPLGDGLWVGIAP